MIIEIVCDSEKSREFLVVHWIFYSKEQRLADLDKMKTRNYQKSFFKWMEKKRVFTLFFILSLNVKVCTWCKHSPFKGEWLWMNFVLCSLYVVDVSVLSFLSYFFFSVFVGYIKIKLSNQSNIENKNECWMLNHKFLCNDDAFLLFFFLSYFFFCCRFIAVFDLMMLLPVLKSPQMEWNLAEFFSMMK